MKHEPLHVLVVDDDEFDVEALVRLFRRNEIQAPIYRAADGEEALAMLRHEEGSVPVPSPTFVLLDLNMPRMNGLEFLEVIRKDPDPKLRRLVVFVLTTSEKEQDIVAAYDSHVAGYIVKAASGRNFSELTSLVDYYKQLVTMP